MYFNVFSDTGDRIEGYLIPDGFSTKPKITVRAHDRVHEPLDCNIFLTGPYNHKHHETGIVGFVLDEQTIPELALSADLEISDADTGFVIYRRFIPEKHIEKRIFRLETQFVPHAEMDRSLKPYFQFHAASAERYGSETVRQMLEIINQPSTYVSGRVMLQGVERYITGDTIRITSIRDPFYELAVRLWSIAAASRRKLSFISERDQFVFENAFAYFADLNFLEPEAVLQKIKLAPKNVLSVFESPFTHQIVAANPTDRIAPDSISAALDALSQFHVFDANESEGRLGSDVAELLGLDEDAVSFSPTRSPFIELSETLRGIPALAHVLEADLILFHFVQKAERHAQAELARAPQE